MAGVQSATLTGVCHQASNRILYLARVTVAGCNGYALSTFIFSAYGRGTWVELPGCTPAGPAVVGSCGGPQSQNGANMTGKDTYDQVVSYAPGESRLTELAALTQLGPGRPLDPLTFSAPADIQAELWYSRQSLAALLLARKLSQEDYLEKLNSAVRASMKNSATLLGNEKFKAIFGDAGRNPDGLTDRSAFLAHPPAGLHPV